MTVKEVLRASFHYFYGKVVKVTELGYDDWAGEYSVAIVFEDGFEFIGYYSDEVDVNY